jgi:hypothetical protein
MRTRDGRRFCRIANSLLDEFGTVDPVRLRELVGLKITAEKIQTAILADDLQADVISSLSEISSPGARANSIQARAGCRSDAAVQRYRHASLSPMTTDIAEMTMARKGVIF